jgi:prepilin-type N-terminal cleavage/methylation domain-containing protein
LRGWTLIESIAVLAVIAILAAILVPPVIKRVDRAVWTRETAELDAYSDALKQSIIRTKSVPTYTNWASTIASQMSTPVSGVLTNARRYARTFLIDPTRNMTLPYTQTINGTGKPNNLRMMIVSSLAGALTIPTGEPSSSDFDTLWNTPDGGTPAGWTISGDDLRIEKLDLEPLFHQVVLFNHDPTNVVAPFSVDRLATNTVASGTNPQADGSTTGWKKYYLEGTDLWLLDSNYNPRTRYLVRRSVSFVFESGAWRGQIQGGETFADTNGQQASDFLRLATTFYNAPQNSGAGNGASPSAVLVSMYTFMFDYVFWATECPHFDYHGEDPSSPGNMPEYNMLNDIGDDNATGGIGKYAGSGGLLK